MTDTTFGFESVRVMAAANALLKMAGCRQRLASCTAALERGYQYRSTTGKTIVVPVFRRFGLYTGIRSILQRVDEKRPFSWLINGQANTNMKELVFHGERVVILYDRSDALQYQYDLMEMDGRDHEQTLELARDRLARMEADPQVAELAEKTSLYFRDDLDEAVTLPFSSFDPNTGAMYHAA